MPPESQNSSKSVRSEAAGKIVPGRIDYSAPKKSSGNEDDIKKQQQSMKDHFKGLGIKGIKSDNDNEIKKQ